MGDVNYLNKLPEPQKNEASVVTPTTEISIPKEETPKDSE